MEVPPFVSSIFTVEAILVTALLVAAGLLGVWLVPSLVSGAGGNRRSKLLHLQLLHGGKNVSLLQLQCDHSANTR